MGGDGFLNVDDHLEPLAENAGGRQVFAAEAIVEEGGRSVGPDSYGPMFFLA